MPGSDEVILLGGGSVLSPAFIDTCRDLGATWLLHHPVDPNLGTEANLDRIRKGPADSHTLS